MSSLPELPRALGLSSFSERPLNPKPGKHPCPSPGKWELGGSGLQAAPPLPPPNTLELCELRGPPGCYECVSSENCGLSPAAALGELRSPARIPCRLLPIARRFLRGQSLHRGRLGSSLAGGPGPGAGGS